MRPLSPREEREDTFALSGTNIATLSAYAIGISRPPPPPQKRERERGQ